MNCKSLSPLISVIVPIYKVEDYLDECIESIINQTYNNIEIILVDDGSPDNCPQKCDEWASKDTRIRVIHKKNGGLSSARNAGVEVANGEYVSFVDSDDTILPEFLEQLYEAFGAFDNVGVTSVCVLRSMDGRISEYNSKWIYSETNIISGCEYSIKMITGECCFTAWNKLYRTDLCRQIFFKEGRNNEDSLYQYYLGKIMCKKNLLFVQLPYAGYVYRMRPDSICTSTQKPLAIDVIKNYEEMISDSIPNSLIYKILVKRRTHRLYSLCDSLLRNKKWYAMYYDEYRSRLKELSFSELRSALSHKELFSSLLHKYIPGVRLFLFTCIKK